MTVWLGSLVAVVPSRWVARRYRSQEGSLQIPPYLPSPLSGKEFNTHNNSPVAFLYFFLLLFLAKEMNGTYRALNLQSQYVD